MKLDKRDLRAHAAEATDMLNQAATPVERVALDLAIAWRHAPHGAAKRRAEARFLRAIELVENYDRAADLANTLYEEVRA